MNFKLKLNKIDIFVIIIMTILSLVLSFCVFYLPKDDGKSVGVYVMGKKEYSLSLQTNTTIVLKQGEYDVENHTFPHLLGDLTIEIKDEKIRISDNVCPNKICVKQGWVSIPNVPITCAPNSVFIVIEDINYETPDIIM